jgi:hypothetical protein
MPWIDCLPLEGIWNPSLIVFIEDIPGELVLLDNFGLKNAFLIEDIPGELVLDDTVSGSNIRVGISDQHLVLED